MTDFQKQILEQLNNFEATICSQVEKASHDDMVITCMKCPFADGIMCSLRCWRNDLLGNGKENDK